MDKLSHHIEALVFVAENSLSFKEIKNCLDEQFATKFKKEDVEKAIAELFEKYQSEDFAVEMVEISNGYRFMTKGAYYPTVATFLKQSTKKKLSRAALETLSIIAYKQPVEKSELEKIRGVSCDYSIQKLLEKELVEIVGRSEGPGRPLLYSTSEKFMDYFGLKSIQDLPKTRDIATAQSSIGDVSIDDVTPMKSSVGKSEEE
ncbi:MAG: SMC-Scp complex subunit ScpB [Bacteroidota bacterium]